MIHKTIKSITILGLCILILVLFVQNAKAVPIIDEIDIPMLGAKYDWGTHVFTISGLTDVKVFYLDGSELEYNAFFSLTTSGLDWNVSNMGKTIEYTENVGTGKINLFDAAIDPPWPTLLSGDLLNLEMTIVDSRLGLFEGEGDFHVSNGTLDEDFGENGGLATIGIAFKVPFDFNNSFTAMANTKLFPTVECNPHCIPEPSILLLLGSLIIGLGLLERRKKIHKK